MCVIIIGSHHYVQGDFVGMLDATRARVAVGSRTYDGTLIGQPPAVVSKRAKKAA